MVEVIVHWDHKPMASIEWLRHSYQMYDYAARAYNVDQLIFIDKHGTLASLAPTNPIVENLSDAIELINPQSTIHFLHMTGAQNLFDYNHPKDAAYIIGPDYNSMEPIFGIGIQIPMANTKMELWASQTLSIILSHRHSLWQ